MDLKTLKGLLGQYISDAAPGGLLNQEWTPQNVRTAGEAMSMIPNPAGDIASGLLAADDWKNGRYGDALLNGVGMLPVIPSLGGITLFHGTTPEKAKKILAEGLQAIDNASSRPKWYTLVDNEDGAKIFGDKVLKVDIPDDIAKQYLWKGDESSYGIQHAIKQNIPSKYIK